MAAFLFAEVLEGIRFALFPQFALEKLLHRNAQNLGEFIKRLRVALEQTGFVAQKVGDRGLRNPAFFRKAVTRHFLRTNEAFEGHDFLLLKLYRLSDIVQERDSAG